MKKRIYNPVNIFYFFLLGFIAIVPVDSGFLVKFLALCFVALIWVTYFVGSSLPGSLKVSVSECQIKYRSSYFFSINLVVLQFVLSLYVGYFYTGLTLVEAVTNIFVGISNYSMYQAYFSEAGLMTFGFRKIPPIISYFYVKLVFVLMLYSFLVRRQRRLDYLLVFLAAVPVLTIGLFRGTSIEIFEVLVGIICSVYVKSRQVGSSSFPVFKTLLGAAGIILVYSLQVNLRYNFEYVPSCKNEFCYDGESLIYRVLPVFYMLSSYFYFGPDYMARLFSFSIDNALFFDFFLPGNGYLFGYEGKWLCENEIKCGPTWSPDFELAIYNFGVPITFILMLWISFFHKKLENSAHFNFVNFLGFFVLTLQLFSLPVGNFLFASSANQLLFIAFLVSFILRKFSVK